MDPWLWSVDQVVETLCQGHALLHDRPHSALPEAQLLERVLRENEINGSTLLCEVDHAVLKDDLGIKRLGQRSAIIYIVERLRRQSPQYLEHHFRVHATGDAPSNRPSTTHSPAWSHARDATKVEGFDTSIIPTSPSLSDTVLQSPAAPSNNQILAPAPNQTLPKTPNVRLGEVIVDVGANQPKRKLTLTPTSTVKGTAHQPQDSSHAWLGRKRMSTGELFYTDNGSGQLMAIEDEGDDVPDDYIITPNPSNLRPGRQIFTYRRVHRMIRNRPITSGLPAQIVKVVGIEDAVVLYDQTSPLRSVQENCFQGRRGLRLISASDKDSNVLPLYGESEVDSEEEERLQESIREENRDPKMQGVEQQSHGQLSKNEVGKIVQGAKADLIALWTDSILPKRLKNARRIWCKAQGRQNEHIRSSRKAIEKLNRRLHQMEDSIGDEIWSRADKLKKQCFIMEQTIFDIQDHLWKIELWKTKEAPPKQVVQQPAPPKPKLVQDEEYEEIESDVDSLGSFIEDDEMLWSSHAGEATSTRSKLQHLSTALQNENHKEFVQLAHVSNHQQPSTDVDVHMGQADQSQEGPEYKPASPPTASIDSITGLLPRSLAQEYEDFGVMDIDPEPSSECVDLTLSSPESDPFANCLPTPTPHLDSEEVLRGLSMSFLEERNDRKRIVLKILLEKIDDITRNAIKTRILENSMAKFRDEISRGLGAISNSAKAMSGMTIQQFREIIALSRLFLCFEASRDIFNLEDRRALLVHISRLGQLSKIKTLTFQNFMKEVMQAHAEFDDDLGPPEKDSTRKGRKRAVIIDENARQKRVAALEKQEQDEARASKLAIQLHGTASSMRSGVYINPNKDENDELIFINSNAGSKIKKHQIDGIRFIWRELVTSGSTEGQGCLLAHTMGLGKTMQTITTLVTIAEASRSKDERIYRQIPETLRTRKTLILCPAGLVDNWKDEFAMWTPADTPNIGMLFVLTARSSRQRRVDMITRWSTESGVLIMSYDLFRIFCGERKKSESDDDASLKTAEFCKYALLNEPSIIVADEAHTLKNPETKTSQTASQFRTKHRLALTGSPLANNLMDYYSMIEWVSPGYFGNKVHFKSEFQEPIQAGFYVDSSPYQRRRAIKKLKILEAEIAPKVQRANISVLRADLKPKTEFVITIPLTPLQRGAYNMFVQSLRGPEKQGNAVVWAKLHLLSLLCNHPRSFWDKLLERETVNDVVSARCATDGNLHEAGDVAASTLGMSSPTFEDQRRLMRAISDSYAQEFSYKMQIIAQILLKAKSIGDKTLIFSHTLPTLNYLEGLLRHHGISYDRLDGATELESRLRMSKAFNTGTKDAFLISTRAGGMGINLPGANRVILVDFNFNPTWEEQAVGRSYRIGQHKEVYVYHFVTGGTFEEIVHNRAMFKTQLAYRVVDGKRPDPYATKDRDWLFEATEPEQKDISQFRGKDVIMDEILALPNCPVRNLSTTDTLHREIDEELTPEEEAEVARERDTRAQQAAAMKQQPVPSSSKPAGTPFKV